MSKVDISKMRCQELLRLEDNLLKKIELLKPIKSERLPGYISLLKQVQARIDEMAFS